MDPSLARAQQLLTELYDANWRIVDVVRASGVHRNTLRAWQRGTSTPEPEMLRDLERAYTELMSQPADEPVETQADRIEALMLTLHDRLDSLVQPVPGSEAARVRAASLAAEAARRRRKRTDTSAREDDDPRAGHDG